MCAPENRLCLYRIVQGSGNARLIGLLGNDLYHLVRMYRCQFAMAGPRCRPAYREHTQVVDAIEDRDGELAEVLMRHHVRASRRHALQRLGELRGDGS